MAVTVKRDLLGYHPSLQLRLAHAAIGSYPVYGRSSLTVNRMLMVFEDSDGGKSYIRDCKSEKTVTIQPGTIYFIPCLHEVEVKLTERVLFVSFQFNLDLFYGFDVFRNYGEFLPIKNPELISDARTFFNKDVDAWMLCRANKIIYEVCSFLLHDRPKISHISHLAVSQYMDILNFIREQGDATTTVATLASMSKMRQDVFSRKFTREMGISPKELIDNTLLRKTIRLLLVSGLSSKEIAEKLNFSSKCYFSRFFKNHTGVSPQTFRNSNGYK